jgi:hypothetical protein
MWVHQKNQKSLYLNVSKEVCIHTVISSYLWAVELYIQIAKKNEDQNLLFLDIWYILLWDKYFPDELLKFILKNKLKTNTK